VIILCSNSTRTNTALEAAGFETWLVNAKDVKHLPGRPKTDKLDAVWLCKVAERQMLRPGFVPPPQVRKLRDLTRYRAGLAAARTAEKQRAEKLPEDACIKLSSVIADIFGVCGRDMLAALIAGERNPTVLAQHARQDHRAGRGVHRPLHRPPRPPARHDAGPGGRDQLRHHRPGGPDRRAGRPVRRRSGPPG
jgi:Transposase